MPFLNIEIKAICKNPDAVKSILKAHKARFAGLDHQLDTYFVVPKGRMKLREGNIENSLIHYLRPDQSGPKASEVCLYHPEPNSSLKEVLTSALQVLTVVDKKREIYFIDNIKFHIDEVKSLGTFVEIEAIDKNGNFNKEQLYAQCSFYLELFGIREEDLVEQSYSDLLMQISK